MDKKMKIYFPRLTKLKPTVLSSVVKLEEEIGELARELTRKPASTPDILSELLDVAQVCATMMFLSESEDAAAAVKAHVWKLFKKGYLNQVPDGIGIVNCAGDKVLVLPALDIRPSLSDTFMKLSEEAGELAQSVGKRQNLSGEQNIPNDFGIMSDLLDIAQVCVTMLYIAVEEWDVDVAELLAQHKRKLKEHGYL